MYMLYNISCVIYNVRKTLNLNNLFTTILCWFLVCYEGMFYCSKLCLKQGMILECIRTINLSLSTTQLRNQGPYLTFVARQRPERALTFFYWNSLQNGTVTCNVNNRVISDFLCHSVINSSIVLCTNTRHPGGEPAPILT